MATLRTLLNRALTQLGHADDLIAEDATTLTDAYHLKVAEWMNDVLEEVEDAAQWRVLRQRETVTISADANSAAMTNANERSRVFRVQDQGTGELVPLVFDVTDSANQYRLQEMDLAKLLYLDQANSNESSGNSPTHFALEQTATGQNLYVWPRPSEERTIEADMIIPQSRMAYTTLPLLDTNVKVPNRVVVMGTIHWAMEDRGEEFGADGGKVGVRYGVMLSDLVSAENAAQGFDELVPT
jgi:hypothetical protein